MKDEKIVNQTQPTASSTIPADIVVGADADLIAVPKKAISLSMDDSIRAAIRDGKGFKLVRRLYEGKNKKYYYGFSVFVCLNNVNFPVKEIQVTPAVGAYKDDNLAAMKNSAGYSFLNMLYDLGNGAVLRCAEDEYVDKAGQVKKSFNFYAVSTDSTGLDNRFPMSAKTAGDRAMLLSAFSGFGGVRDWEESDRTDSSTSLSANRAAVLSQLFIGYMAPGVVPKVTVENQ